MSQQCILLRKENDLLNSLIGQSFNSKNKFEAEKILQEIHSKAQDRSIGKMALCYIVDKNEIKGVGGSSLMKDKNGKIISNLILDQFGEYLSKQFKKLDGTDLLFAIKSTTGALQTLRAYSSSSVFNLFGVGNIGISLIVGSGTTPPVRTDFSLETAFGTAPESGSFVPTTNPIWNSGLGNFKQNGAIIAGGAGTINESALATNWRDSAGVIRGFILFRDIISPAQSFISGQSIALEYTVQL